MGKLNFKPWWTSDQIMRHGLTHLLKGLAPTLKAKKIRDIVKKTMRETKRRAA